MLRQGITGHNFHLLKCKVQVWCWLTTIQQYNWPFGFGLSFSHTVQHSQLLRFMSMSEKLNFPISFFFSPTSPPPLTAHWRYTVSARVTRLSTSASLRTAPAPHRPVLASQCSGLMDYPVCPPTCRPRPSHPPPSRCPGGSPIRTLRTLLVMCCISAGPQVGPHWRSK